MVFYRINITHKAFFLDSIILNLMKILVLRLL